MLNTGPLNTVIIPLLTSSLNYLGAIEAREKAGSS